MSSKITLNPSTLTKIRNRDMRQQSYNIEMTELTGGTFWKPYTPEQISGAEPFPVPDNPEDVMELLKGLHIQIPAINLYEPRIRTLAKALAPSVIRFSGSWATRTYYDLDNSTGGKVPDGFEYILTKEQWQGALDFVKEVGGEILVSVANCTGVHKDGTGEWIPYQAAALWDYTASQGMKIDYAEFMNEPNLLIDPLLPPNYNSEAFGRDHDLFADWLYKNHPETKLVGPCAADSPRNAMVGGSLIELLTTEDLLKHIKAVPKYYSFHSYTGNSERGQFFGSHHPFSKALTEEYLGLTMSDLDYAMKLRDGYAPDADMWITESADAACGGSTWAPTFVECIRYIDEMCRFSTKTKGIIFHNTLASSAYGLLDAETHQPRPQYWAGLLFNRLTGETVYDTHEQIREGVHLYAYSLKGNDKGVCYIYINNSQTDSAFVETPSCLRYTLSSDALRSQKIMLNGKVLEMPDEYTMPELNGVSTPAGSTELKPCTITFFVIE